MSSDKPWSPTLENPDNFIDHKNPALGKNDPPLQIPQPDEDTAPLQGSKDLSDADSLEDVIASSYDDGTAASGAVQPDKTKVLSGVYAPKR